MAFPLGFLPRLAAAALLLVLLSLRRAAGTSPPPWRWQAGDFLHASITQPERLPLTTHAAYCWRNLGGQPVRSVVVLGSAAAAADAAAAVRRRGHDGGATQAGEASTHVAWIADVWPGYVMPGDFRFAMAPLVAHAHVNGTGYKWM